MKHTLRFLGLSVFVFLGIQVALYAQKTETRNVSGFSTIDASSAFVITVNKAADESLVIEADEDILPYVRSEVKNGVLKLYLDNQKKFSNIKTLKATIGIKDLKKVKLSGACKLLSSDLFTTPSFDVDMSGACSIKLNVKTDDLDVSVNGASNVDMEADTREAEFEASGASRLIVQLKAVEASFDMNGACKAELKGVVDKAEFEVSGATAVKALELLCKAVEAECSGVSKLELNASDRLMVECSGSSVVYYKGRPSLSVNTSGSSKVKSID